MTTASASIPLNRESDRPALWERLFWAIVLSLSVFALYGIANIITARRADAGAHIPTFTFGFERRVPFIAAMIVPYMSIDLFWVAAPLVCTTDQFLRLYIRRMLLSTIVACSVFLFCPLQFALARPIETGVFKPLFGLLYTFDQPYNLAPSLHIACLVILWPVYISRIARRLRPLLAFWFLLIGASTLFVYQHHLTDVLTGLLLGVLCLYIFPATPDNAA
jgi:membrane-associated phospholipid phosphatase